MTQYLDVTEMTIEKVHAGYQSKNFTCEELTQAFLDRIKRYNQQYNAIIFLNEEAAIEDARRFDIARNSQDEDQFHKFGPLGGVPIVVKDTMDIVGFPTTSGWSLLYSGSTKVGIDLLPPRDSAVVHRMKEAGAIILGKTNTPILSCSGTDANNSWAGRTLNAAAPEYAPGASSTGTATAVAASFCVLGLAEETGGSIQNPASAQGLVGIKPTFGLVPNTGVMPLSSLRDVVGPIARCVRDAALALDVLVGITADDPNIVAGIGNTPEGGYASKLSANALQNKRLGLYGSGWRQMDLSPEVNRIYYKACEQISSLCGAILVPDPFSGSGFSSISNVAHGGIVTFDYRGMESLPYDLNCYLERFGRTAPIHNFDSFIKATASENIFAPGAMLGALATDCEFQTCFDNPTVRPVLKSFAIAQDAYRCLFDRVMDGNDIDMLVFPQMIAALPKCNSGDQINATTVSEINIAGLPGVTVPAGEFDSGAPFCLIFIGRLWSEQLLLNSAYAYEFATKHRKCPVLSLLVSDM